MSYSRGRYETAQQAVVDAIQAGSVSETCANCPATRAMAGAAVETGRGPETDGAQSVARGYLNVIAGCTGAEACEGVTFVQGPAEMSPLAPPNP